MISGGWTGDVCQANGLDIHYLRTGGSKPPLIALHGLMGSGECLSPLARVLEVDFDVILPDARGHGGSSAPEAGYLYDDLATDVIGLIDALKLDTPVLIGYSMGGLTAAVVAGRRGPDLKSVVLIDPTFINLEWQREVYESDLEAEHREFLGSNKIDLLAQARVTSPLRSQELIEFLVNARLQTCVSAFEVLTPPNPDCRDLISAIKVPTLLLVGERGVVSREISRELLDLQPSLTCEVIPDAGHGLPYDQPQQLGAAILLFLRETIPFERAV
jgi:N-formylmaleamate deformylase